MHSHLLQDESEINRMRALIASISEGSSVTDFDEFIQLPSIRKATRLWTDDETLIAFAYVDDYQNLCFEIASGFSSNTLELEIVAWGVECLKTKQRMNQKDPTLDAYCSGSNFTRTSLLERNGFIQSPIQTLCFSLDLSKPIEPFPLPDGYYIRLSLGESEIKQLVALHQAVFESDQMTVEYRRAIMACPQYSADMDWVIVTPEGELAAFCLGSFDESTQLIGHLDPIGVHPDYQGKGLGSAILTHGLMEQKQRGVTSVLLGTSSVNLGMQKLARKTGFKPISKVLWFSRGTN
jgi:mycothiol synthase